MDKHENREDRRRRDNRSFAAIYKAQTKDKPTRILIVVILLLLAGVVVSQGMIATGDLTRPVYLADFVR